MRKQTARKEFAVKKDYEEQERYSNKQQERTRKQTARKGLATKKQYEYTRKRLHATYRMHENNRENGTRREAKL